MNKVKKRTEYPINKFIFTSIAYVYNTIYFIVYLGKKPLIERERNGMTEMEESTNEIISMS